MADVAVVAANVAKAAGGWLRTGDGTLGETVTAGQAIQRSRTDGLWYKARATTALLSGSYRGRNVAIALNGGSINQPVEYAYDGILYLGVALVAGQVYVVSATLGGIAPYADLLTTHYVTVLGVGNAAGNLELFPFISGAAKP